ncbi:MFS transporter [Ramlibacter sp. AW1]|uniref:MFS transporter n=1 Tax=Ramlibacter aurantiacus TaxID=2801330 RepID=A0A936ZHK3_9BURK|nr:MFS transporter [Ramlibacter aurantiacus]MBL0421569.1 MFS transporter [Ramlibacter aurantiacus]
MKTHATGAALSSSTPSTRPWHILPVIVLAQFAGTSVWFSGNAVIAELDRVLGLGGPAHGAVTSAVQGGFIAGTLVFALFNIADRWRPRDVFLACAVLAALANGAMALLPQLDSGRYPALLAARFAAGFFLAGIYPVGMKIAASWYREGLGAALGWLVGALVVGTALPHLLRGSLPAGGWVPVVLAVSLLAVAGGVLLHRVVPEGPFLQPAPKFDPGALVRAFAAPDFRASAFGYFGHMWELYTLWAFAPLMLAAYAQRHGVGIDVPLWSFFIIGAGGLGCVAGGLVSRRAGSARVAFGQLGLSGLCCLASPLAYALPPIGFLAFMVFWGVVVAGDSPQFSALNAATAPRAFVGSALTIANCIGFAISVVSLQAMSLAADRLPVAWWFVPVAIGPALGLLACRRLAARGA